MENNNRRKLTVRLTQEQFELLEYKLSKTKMNKNNFIISLIEDKELSSKKEVNFNTFRELQRIGVNLNQISKSLNTDKSLSDNNKKQLLERQKQLANYLKKVKSEILEVGV